MVKASDTNLQIFTDDGTLNSHLNKSDKRFSFFEMKRVLSDEEEEQEEVWNGSLSDLLVMSDAKRTAILSSWPDVVSSRLASLYKDPITLAASRPRHRMSFGGRAPRRRADEVGHVESVDVWKLLRLPGMRDVLNVCVSQSNMDLPLWRSCWQKSNDAFMFLEAGADPWLYDAGGRSLIWCLHYGEVYRVSRKNTLWNTIYPPDLEINTRSPLLVPFGASHVLLVARKSLAISRVVSTTSFHSPFNQQPKPRAMPYSERRFALCAYSISCF